MRVSENLATIKELVKELVKSTHTKAPVTSKALEDALGAALPAREDGVREIHEWERARYFRLP